VIVSQVACLADAARVKLALGVDAQLGLLNAALRVIAVLAHTARVIMIVHVLALCDHLSVLYLPLIRLGRRRCLPITLIVAFGRWGLCLLFYHCSWLRFRLQVLPFAKGRSLLRSLNHDLSLFFLLLPLPFALWFRMQNLLGGLLWMALTQVRVARL